MLLNIFSLLIFGGVSKHGMPTKGGILFFDPAPFKTKKKHFFCDT
jgi:hypothetical protein